jgi:hypothetical protein
MTRRYARPRRSVLRQRLAGFGSALEVLEPRQLLSFFTVTSAADDGRAGTLRAAIIAANKSPGSEIEFDIPGSGTSPVVITLQSALPALTAPTIVSGYSQPGSITNGTVGTDADIDQATLMVQLDGSHIAAANTDGLDIEAANCFVSGLIITGFTGNGIVISGAGSQGNFLWGNFVGTVPNPGTGRDFPTAPSTPGAQAYANGGVGILVEASNNRIGGDTSGLRNVVQGNLIGVAFEGPGATGNLLQGNFILHSATQGVFVDSSNNTIGEDISGGGNYISGNGAQGILITGGTGVQGNQVVGNLIGTDLGTLSTPGGLLPLPNTDQGILIDNSPNNTIGGLLTSSLNVIAANGSDGLAIQGASATGNLVEGNYFGFNITGGLESLAIGNTLNGIRIASSGNTIGGTATAAQNTIGLNKQNGIELDGPGASGNLIDGNVIGLNPGAGSDFGNTLDGISLNNAGNNTVGGTIAGARNVISGNNNGITLNGSGATGNLIQGNFVGTKGDGVSRLENSVDGVAINNAPRNTVGGVAAAAANVISGNNRGITITSTNLSATNPGSVGNMIEGNRIGTDLSGSVPLGNSIDGIAITNSSNNTVGGTAAGAQNVIAFNAGNGILVVSGTGNAIVSNQIYTNNQLGINLGGGTGVLANHPGGSTSGPNLNTNYPVLTAATPNAGATNIQGSFNALPNTSYTIQFFSNPAMDPTGFGEGKNLIGATTVRTDGSGNATLNLNLPVTVVSGQFITATATDPNGNTSEFSNDVEDLPVSAPANPLIVTSTADDGSAGTLRAAIIAANKNPGSEIDFAIPNSSSSPVVITLLSALPAITVPTIINGYSEPGTIINGFGSGGIIGNTGGSLNGNTDDDQAQLIIQLDGSHITAPNTDGLDLQTSSCVVSGLIITGFTGNGITINGAGAQGNFIWGNFIGTVPNPTAGRDFPLSVSSSSAKPYGNGGAGILVESSNNQIGGNTPGFRNVVQGNQIGVAFEGSGATGNRLQGNFVLHSLAEGIFVDSSNNTIGEDVSGGGNYISGNGAQGILITGGPGVQGNQVVGNLIGTDLGQHTAGTTITDISGGFNPLPNGAQGILINNSPNNTIGGLLTGSRNVIAASGSDGLAIEGAASTGNLVQGNYFGFNIGLALESLTLGNLLSGIRIASANNTVGGTAAAAQNTIGLNKGNGIELDGPGASGNLIQGNVIGLDPTATISYSNAFDGIDLNNAGNNTIGGSVLGARNVISGNNNGITLNGSGAAGNLIQGNYIGTKGDGVTRMENSVDGVALNNAPLNTIGGVNPGAGNVISGNNRGITITSTNLSATNPGAIGNLVEGNFIGTDPSGSLPIGNSVDGITITNSSNNTVGGTTTGAGNIIAFNAGNGVLIASGAGNTILSNQVYGNNQLGINLGGGGVLPNHLGGSTTGPNLDQNYPVLTAATPSAGTTNVQGTFNALPNTLYTVQFFSNPSQDRTGYGEGRTLLATTTVLTDQNGNASLNVNIAVAVPSGQFVTATATDPSGNTSEFSNDMASTPVAAPPNPLVVTSTADDGSTGTLRAAIIAANSIPGSEIDFDIQNIGLGPAIITLQSALPALTAPTIVNGYSQPGSVGNGTSGSDADIDQAQLMVQLDGSHITSANTDGLDIEAPNCFVSGLIITGFTGNGIVIRGANAQGNFVWGNFLGTVPNPTPGRDFPLMVSSASVRPYGNGGAGILVLSSNNRIGGDSPGLRNVIQGNQIGVAFEGASATGNLLQGNFVLHSVTEGVFVDSSNNTIGEDLSGGGNYISGNGAQGILITGGTPVQGNQVVGNLIGTDIGSTATPGGLLPLPNAAQGILIDDSPNNTIGGLLSDSRNVIAGNTSDGLAIQGPDAIGNLVEGNYFGFNISGGLESLAIGNTRDGIRIASAGNIIGGTTSAAQNTIGINKNHGIELDGPGASNNLIQGNVIGLNPGAGSDFGNTLDGINLNNAANNTIGGTTVGARNVISGNNNGITLNGSGTTGNLIEGNFIGTKGDGLTRLENSIDGVAINNAPLNTVGGTASGAGNVISGNNRGIEITSTNLSSTNPGAQDNLIQGNFVGTDLTGKVPVGNSIDGILISNSSNNTVGGSVAAAKNTIAFNAGNGVVVASGTGNAILSNQIYSNTQLGINLGGGSVLANHPGGSAAGPNLDENYPVLTAGAPNTSTTNIQGSFNALPNTSYTIQFFSNVTQDPTGFGQGATFLGATTVLTDQNGNAPVNYDVPVVVPSGQFITATATDPNGNTSEFSNDIPSVPVSVQFTQSSYTVDQSAGVATITVTRTGGTGGQVIVAFTTGGGTGKPGTDYTTTSGTLTFNPGVATQTFTIPITPKTQVGPSVTVNLTLSHATGGATLGANSTATLTIKNTIQPTMQFSASAYAVSESAGTVTITVSRNTTVGTTTVAYATLGGSAIAGQDYTAASGTLTFKPGQTSASFAVPINDRFRTVGSETIGLKLKNPQGGIIGTRSTAVLTVRNDDRAGTLQFGATNYSVAQTAGTVPITVSRLGGAGGTVAVAYAVTAGTATAGVNFKPVSGTLVFKPGQTSQTINVPVFNAQAVGNHTIKLALSRPTGGASLGSTHAATLTIVGYNPSDPHLPGPLVTGVTLQSNGAAITGILLSFNEPLGPVRAQDVGNYGYFIVGASSTNASGMPGDFSVPIASAVYKAASHQVLLTPRTPLPLNGFYQVSVNPQSALQAGRGVVDANGVLLDGTLNGGSGTSYSAIVGFGNHLNYTDAAGNQVSLQLSAGLMELIRTPAGNAVSLQIINGVAGRSELSGQAKLSPSGRRSGVSIPTITGTSGVRIKLAAPSFQIGRILP